MSEAQKQEVKRAAAAMAKLPEGDRKYLIGYMDGVASANAAAKEAKEHDQRAGQGS